MTQYENQPWPPPPPATGYPTPPPAAAYPAPPPYAPAGGYPAPQQMMLPQRAPQALSVIVVVLLLGYCALSIGYALHSFLLDDLMRDLENGVRTDTTREASLDSFGATMAMFQMIVLVAAAVFVIAWMWAARSNAETYAPGDFRRARGWTIGGWVCPVVWWWFPYQCMKDITAASDPQRPPGLPAKTYSTAGSRLLGWWTLWVIGPVISRASAAAYQNAQTFSELRTSFYLDYLNTAVDLVCAALLIAAVVRVTRWQGQRYAVAIQGQQQWSGIPQAPGWSR